MAIVCGVDFSDSSLAAVRVAAALAKLGQTKLALVHAAELAHGADESSQTYLALGEARLSRKARRLREQGMDIERIVEPGVPDEVLLAAAYRGSASMLVIGPKGHRHGATAELGSHAERLARAAHVPVVVARDPAPFDAWARRERPLRVVVGVNSPADAAPVVVAATELARLAPCEITVLHFYWPLGEWARLGLSGFRDVTQPDPEVVEALTRELESCTKPLADVAAQLHIQPEPHLGAVGHQLANTAARQKADVLIVGSRMRGLMRRLWEGSVSRAALEAAAMSVICVPLEGRALSVRPSADDTLLVATDFSERAQEAVQLAYRSTKQGRVVLVHVVPRLPQSSVAPHDIFGESPSREAVREKLTSLIPAEARARGIQTVVHALNSDDIGDAICQAAERLGAEAIYLGTRGHTGAKGTLLGSVSASVVQRSKRRVVLVRPARE